MLFAGFEDDGRRRRGSVSSDFSLSLRLARSAVAVDEFGAERSDVEKS